MPNKPLNGTAYRRPLAWALAKQRSTRMKVTCPECGASILQQTADRNGGLCAPCRNGTRRSIEAARKQRELERTDPFHMLFQALRDRSSRDGFAALRESEATYYSVSALYSDLNRGAVQLFFSVNAPAFRKLAMDGLATLGRSDLVLRLEEAGRLCAKQDSWYTSDHGEAEDSPYEEELAQITDGLLMCSQDVFERLERFAIERQLVTPEDQKASKEQTEKK